jgi:predicted nucleic acid-binding protein
MPDAYLLDTSIATIAWDGGHPSHALVRGRLAALGDDPISVCAISIGEKEYGLQVSPGIDIERSQAVRNAMSQYHAWQIDHHTGTTYGQLRGELFKRYASRDKRGRLTAKRPEELLDKTTARELGIQENDLWIVSVAVTYDLYLITADKRLERILEIARDKFGYDRADVWDIPAPPKADPP